MLPHVDRSNKKIEVVLEVVVCIYGTELQRKLIY